MSRKQLIAVAFSWFVGLWCYLLCKLCGVRLDGTSIALFFCLTFVSTLFALRVIWTEP